MTRRHTQLLTLAMSSLCFGATVGAQPAKPVPAAPVQAKAVKVKEDKPGLLAKAKVTPDSAMAIARLALPGGTITEAEIENEDGALIYSFDMKVAGKKGTEEIHVDAASGKVLKREHESEASEKKEKADELAAKAKKGKPPV